MSSQDARLNSVRSFWKIFFNSSLSEMLKTCCHVICNNFSTERDKKISKSKNFNRARKLQLKFQLNQSILLFLGVNPCSRVNFRVSRLAAEGYLRHTYTGGLGNMKMILVCVCVGRCVCVSASGCPNNASQTVLIRNINKAYPFL